jgi:hypothetical protein
MNNLETQLETLVNQFGIEAVMSSIKSNHSDKVFIPNWYYQHHLEEMGFEFDEEYNDMCAFTEFMEDHNIYELTTELVSEDYPTMWEEYIEENK